MATLKIVLTGATGLLGNRVLDRLRDKHEVHVLVRSLPTVRQSNVSYHVENLAATPSFASLPKQIDVVVHLAQSSKMREFPERALDIFGVNLAATAALLDYARRAGASNFVLASTGGLYRSSPSVLKESSPLEPPRGQLGFYFDTKMGAELMARAYSDHMSVSIVRPFFIYGPGQRDTMLIPRLIDSVRSRRAIRLRGESGTRMNPIYVDDAASIVEACLRAPSSEVFNLAGPDAATVRTIADTIGLLIGIDPIFEIEPGEADCLVADITKMSTLLDHPLTNLGEGLKTTTHALGIHS